VKRFARACRGHWSIENQLHWVVDIAFDEDHSRTRKGHAAENLASIRHEALNLLKQEKTAKVGIKTKRKMCGWDHNLSAESAGAAARLSALAGLANPQDQPCEHGPHPTRQRQRLFGLLFGDQLQRHQ
jgi:hypothetical protein